MLSLHQLRVFLAVYEHGSLTAAAEELGYAQPSISEQVRSLERTLGVQLFRRVGRGVVPTGVADELRPHAERTVAAAEDARKAVQAVKQFETGTIRFGMFGIARLYGGAGLVADVLDRYPGVRVELIGQNSTEVQEDLRRGRLEAAMLLVGSVSGPGLKVTPVARDELVYISADPAHLATPVTAHRLSLATLVMSDTSWSSEDPTRVTIRNLLHETGRNPPSRVEVEDIETAVELVGMGYADSVIAKGAAEQLLPRLAPKAGWVSLRPRTYDTFAIVHRTDATLSPAATLMIELATKRIRAIADPVHRR
ncbi:LysR family transcriptional regulator [Nocardioides albus]|uniref:DNA-binding transcriptional LysR family regulator n=1 Tax=Nocardioides albus TaxID=1841 RepID=A0A7W5FAV7_9ACTN|nr:LysR family transcriptional regulator [Nocardioides albus]MBB3091571.1 DNA-binding transcriptional LysR family regulator [Nocardioides albus]GGU40866.1 LysR family transcriptional regulator [Nocardioides albus]